MNKRRAGQQKQSARQSIQKALIREEERQLFHTKFEQKGLPFIKKITNLYAYAARFDQCVIDRGAGMKDQLNILQQHLYNIYSDIENELQGAGLSSGYTTQFVRDRLSVYQRYRAGDEAAYDILLELSKQFPSVDQLVDLAYTIDRGGKPTGMRPSNKLIGQLASKLEGYNLHERAVEVKKKNQWLDGGKR